MYIFRGAHVHFCAGFAGNSIKKRGFPRFEKGSAPIFLRGRAKRKVRRRALTKTFAF